MKLFQFDSSATVDGNAYVARQVVAFPDDFDLSSLPGSNVISAPVFVDHVPREIPPITGG